MYVCRQFVATFLLVAGGAHPPLVADEPKTKELAALEYRLVGPFAGGRVSRACGVPGDPLTYYAATASGGVWKSADGGKVWKPIFDDQPTSSIGSIAVAASDPNVVYVGTGEANIRGNVAPGAGIFKSTDAGKTWKHVWKHVGQIGTVVVHPKNADVAFAAVLGHAFGPNSERGVYRTTDGGKTWGRVLFQNDETGCSDVAIDPSNPRVVFAGFWQARRRPWEMTSGGPGSDLFVSRDGGDTWTSLANGRRGPVGGDARPNGLPPKPWGKVGVAVSPSDSQRVYALIEAEKGGLFRSDDGGEKWQGVNDSRELRQRAWYYTTLTVHPTNPDVVFAPNVDLFKSADGGHTFKKVPGSHHGDYHDVWFDPKNPDRVINANDGGVDISTDGGKSWFAPPLPISQCYHVSADTRTPYRVMACLQDLGSASGPSNSLKSGGIGLGDWHQVGGGEAGYAFADPSDPDVVYAGEYGGILTRYDHRTGQARNVTVNQFNPSGVDPAKMKYRFQWTAPVLISPHDSKTVYHAANVLFRTRDAGQTWEKVSNDLTRNDKQKQQWSGGPITGDNTGVEVYGTIFALAESPLQKGLLWAGSDDGLVHVSKDAGKTWQNVTAKIPNMPDWGTVCCIEPGKSDAGTAYVVVRNHRMDDYKPYVWKTTDFGQSWKSLAEGLDPATHCHVIREDNREKDTLYLGTERGVVYRTRTTGWKSLQQNLPTVPVHDLVVKGESLVVGTHGRSIWILDDLSPVRAIGYVKDEPSHLYSPMPATRWRQSWGGPTATFMAHAAGDNPPNGAAIWFDLGKDEDDEIFIRITDEKWNTIAEAVGTSEAAKDDEEKEDDDDAPKRKFKYTPGALNRYVWDLTHDGATVIPKAPVDMGSAGQRIPVAPGKYRVTLGGVKNKVSEHWIEVRPDPRWANPAPAVPPADESAALATALKRRIDPTDLKNVTIRPLTPSRIEIILPTTGAKSGAKDVTTAEIEEMKRLIQRVGSLEFKPADPAGALVEQEKLALRVRDDISNLSDTVLRLRAIKKQIDLRKELFTDVKTAAELLKQSEALGKKLDGIEEKLHNPKAKIGYDIFAARGGAMLYSQFAWLLANLTDSDGAPTRAQQDLAAELEKELSGLVGQFEGVVKADVGKLNEAAKKLGVPELYVPLPKTPAEPKPKKK